MSLGIAMIIEANLGVSSWDVLHVGLFYTFGLTIGTWSQIVGLIVIVITFFMDRKMVGVGTVLNMIFVGIFIDIFLFILPVMNYWVYQYLFLLLAILIMGMGAGLYITAKLGPGPRDGLMLVLNKRYGWSVGKVKTSMELIVLSVGWLLGGPVFIGTIISAVLIGPVMQFFINWWEKILESLFSLSMNKEKETLS